jgi:uncharacterized protein YjcR
MKHINKEEKRWAYDRWCEGYTYAQIAEALNLSEAQVCEALRELPRIRPMLHYTPKGEDKNAKEIIMQMATSAINAAKKNEQGHKSFSEEQQQRYGKELLNIVTALYNAGYRKETKR